MSTEKLELLLNDTSEAFGHGLCLAYSLLVDLQSAFEMFKHVIKSNSYILFFALKN